MSKPTITIDGDDILVTGARTTWFGGIDDPSDDGSTASGFSTKAHPDAMGAAIPMEIPGFKPTQGSGIPKVPWLTIIQVLTMGPASVTGASVPQGERRGLNVALIDIGPAVSTGNYLDLTKPAFIALGGDPHVGSMIVDYRIKGGAKYLPKPLA